MLIPLEDVDVGWHEYHWNSVTGEVFIVGESSYHGQILVSGVLKGLPSCSRALETSVCLLPLSWATYHFSQEIKHHYPQLFNSIHYPLSNSLYLKGNRAFFFKGALWRQKWHVWMFLGSYYTYRVKMFFLWWFFFPKQSYIEMAEFLLLSASDSLFLDQALLIELSIFIWSPCC